VNTRSLRFRMTAWYAGLLSASLILFGASVYLGLERYLDAGLRTSLAEQTRSIGEKLLVDVRAKGEQYVILEVNEHYAPEINGRFIRITRPDGSVLYQSSVPKDGSFDPARVSMQPLLARANSYRREVLGETSLLIHSYSYAPPDGEKFNIEVGAPYEQIAKVLHGLLLILAVGLPIIVATAILGGYWVMQRALKPVNEIAEQMERISSRNLNDRLPRIDSGDELERLSISLNHMIGRLDDSFQHINRFSADVSHELRTPLTILRGELEILSQQLNSVEHLEMLGTALEEVERLAKIVDQLLAISRLDAGEACRERVRLDLGALVTSTADQLRLLADEKSISLVFDVAAGVEVEADQIRLRQVIANLLDNAIKYTHSAGRIKVSVGRGHELAIVEIEDNGAGIAAESLPHIFDRFYRADKARSRSSGGSGLGLAIVKAICAAHGAEIKVFSTERTGSRFRVEWALAQSSALPVSNEMASGALGSPVSFVKKTALH
jgi:heavy metal sensor kinase